MPKLFVAIELPPPAAAQLALIRPAPAAGVRLTEAAQMHVTLHYLGEFEVGRAASALGAVAAPAFSLALEGVGRFASLAGVTTLWAGVRACGALLALHSAVGDALARESFRPEARPYVPHVTLARCEPDVPAAVADEFLTRHAGFSLPGVPVAAFVLFSSTLVDGRPVYRLERSFPLLSGAGGRPVAAHGPGENESRE